MMAYSAWNIYSINDEYEEVDEVYDELIEKFIIIEEANDTDPGKPNDTTEVTKAPEVKISFEELVQLYPDVIGWLYCEGTPINYPVVQAKDNDYYLRRMINGKYNIGGTIFMDYRNNKDFSDEITIIYGHNMKNGSMFGVIPKYTKHSFLESHKNILLTTPDKKYEIEVIGTLKTTSDDEVYNFSDLAENRRKVAQRLGIEANDDRLVVFSTCLYDTEDSRLLLVGKLKEKAPE